MNHSYYHILNTKKYGRTYAELQKVGSTNSFVKEKSNILPDGFTALASSQTNGRGRLGKSFYSSDGNGIYMSVLVKDKTICEDSLVTVKSCLAVCSALESLYNIKNISVKWVNDLYYNGRKFCGVLTERKTSKDSSVLVIGIGLNISVPREEFDKEYARFASSLDEFYNGKTDRYELCAEILNKLEYYLLQTGEDFRKKCVEEYKSRSFLVGKDVYVLKGEEKKEAKAIDVDDNVHLVVTYPDGTTEALSSGDVSIKIL